ncbi:MAG: hypothetical protein PHY34_01595 [Patescibacteria group bacterium]|nr:hypothetical protein [Patescibacteria group bacterium]MDD5715085.1 hypothetical protein [Patescibacteria group bacterium]
MNIFNPSELFANLPSADNPFSAMLLIFLHGGWIFVIVSILLGAWWGYVEYIQNRFDSRLKFILLAIDIPRNNEQSPKAVEHIFAHLHGIRKRGNLKERFIKGYNQPGISLEIVSVEGYIQFLIRAPEKFRDLVEAAIYAQYPDAEITEVEDYVNMIPKPLELPHPVWDIWGTEYKLAHSDLFPLKTYPLFEHSLSQKLMDPMASLLEIMSRMGPGEHSWLQIVIAPIDDAWKDRGRALINKLIGKKAEKKGVDLLYFPREIGKGLSESFTAGIVPTTEMGEQQKKKEKEWPSMMQHLSPLDKEEVEAVTMKISKLGFKSKIRLLYAAKRNVFHKPRGVQAIDGALAQFSSPTLNRLVMNKKTRTKIDYFFIKTRVLGRKRRILWGYRYRSMKRGRPGYTLNTEELASLWHFPTIDVKAATIQKVGAKKAMAPGELPYEQINQPTLKPNPVSTNIPKASPPPNLPLA